MKIESKKRALDKIYKRRDRYEIPDWQRKKVWNKERRQELVDSILLGWKLPKFYFLRTGEEPEEYEVVDGQQRLMTIFEFLDGQLTLSDETSKKFRATTYKDLPSGISDAFDDFEIEYDEITDATEQEIKKYFQRLQRGLSLNSSEKLNAVHSSLRNYCRELAKHEFFISKVGFADKRYAYFDVISKAAVVEIETIETSLRFQDLKLVFEEQANFSPKSAIGKRLTATLDYLNRAFPTKSRELRNRSFVQSIVTLAAYIVATNRSAGSEQKFRAFVKGFVAELSRQVELGLDATDEDYLDFQRSVSANTRGAARIRHIILLRKLLRMEPSFAELLGPALVAESGLGADIKRLAETIGDIIEKSNAKYSAKEGRDLFKPTNKTLPALRRIGKVIRNFGNYKAFIDDLYFLLHEGVGSRLSKKFLESFQDVNTLRTDLQHDLDHGESKDVKAKRKKISSTFGKFVSSPTPSTTEPEQFPVFQVGLLSSIERDLRNIYNSL